MGDECEVEAILEHAGSTMKDLEYRVKWVGDDATWESISHLRGTANELLREYHERQGLRVYNWMRS